MATSSAPIKKGTAPTIRKLKMRYPEMSHAQIAKRVGCRPNNVSAVLRKFLGKRTVEDLRDFQSNQADILDTLKANLLESITPSKIAKASALQIATAYGIMYDKAALLRGQATGINVVALLDVVKAIKESELHRLPAARVVQAVPASCPPNSSAAA